MTENSFETGFQSVCDKLIALAEKQGVLATPIEVGGAVIVPVSELKLGFGGAGGEGTGEGDCGTGCNGRGTGVASVGVGNVKVTPMAFVVINGDTVTMDNLADEGGTK